MIDHNAVIKAIVEGKLSDAGNGTISLVATDEEGPPSTIRWQVDRGMSCVRCHRNFRDASTGRFSALAERLALLMTILQAAHQHDPGDGSALLHLGDAPIGDPGIAFCSARSEDLLVPDRDFLISGGYAHLNYDEQPPWQRRLPVALWRGATTGLWPEGGWRDLPRLQLCRMALRAPQIDAGITNVGQLPEGAAEEIAEAGLMRAYIPRELFHLYRCHIDIDGNSNSWPGLFTKLLTGSPVLKVASPHGFRQWYYDRMVPWEHYVPVASDLSDLVEKADWLLAVGAYAAKIGAAGRALALSMTFEREIADAGLRIARWLQRASPHADRADADRLLICRGAQPENHQTTGASSDQKQPISYLIMTAHGTFLALDRNSNLVQLHHTLEDEARLIRIGQREDGHFIAPPSMIDYDIGESTTGFSFKKTELFFKKDGKFLCAARESMEVAPNRDARGPWETFHPIKAEWFQRKPS